MKRRIVNFVLIVVLILSFSTAATAAPAGVARPERPLPASLAELKLDAQATAEMTAPTAKIAAGLAGATGVQRILVRLSQTSVAERAINDKLNLGMGAVLRGQLKIVKSQQSAFIKQVRTLDPNVKVLGQTQRVLNAVMLSVDASVLPQLAQDPNVLRISQVADYEIDLSETVPYIGGTAVQGMGYTGAGVRVAVIDSGIDYLHEALGGSGDPAEFDANDPNIVEPGTFPTAKVVGGYDFVGGAWVSGLAEVPDPDPLDAGSGGGHGTHVADIIGGKLGVAPDASLYALKVCSSITTSCSGVAMLQAIDWALDPNGDGKLDDHVDIINMSIGSPYGQSFDDDTSQAVDTATYLGVLTVTSSGNSSDKPYVTGTPGAAPTALATAQTNVPSAFQPLMLVVSPASIAGQYAAVFQPWSVPLAGVIEAPVQYGDGAGGNLLGCSPFAAGSLAGKIVLVDRGGCNFSLKSQYVGEAGGLITIIGLVAPGDPFEGGYGGQPQTIPAYMISQKDSNTIKGKLAEGVVAHFDPSQGIALAQHMVGSSSRGPTNWKNLIKPEIGAPGASISAVAGTGTGTEPFGGTSGASPMVAGSAALLKQAFPTRSPLELKAALVNNGETEIMNIPAFFGGDKAPITRIGGGEVRVDRALAAPAAAWENVTPFLKVPTLSYGFVDVTKNLAFPGRWITIHNYSAAPITYKATSTFRFANDEANGAVKVMLKPDTITVPAMGEAKVQVMLTIEAAKLRPWTLNSGGQGANANLLTTLEYDGYIWFDNINTADDDAQMLHMPWHVLPRLSDNVTIDPATVTINSQAFDLPAGSTKLMNLAAGPAYIDAYSLIATSPDLPAGGWGEQSPIVDLKNVGVATFPVPAGFCGDVDSFVMVFAINTWERQTHANAPALFEVDLDVDQDGEMDYAIYSGDLAYPAFSDGRSVTWVLDLSTGSADAWFYTDHATNSANTLLTFCGDQIGMTAENFGQMMDASVFAVDSYFTGDVTDYIEGLTLAPLGERYLGFIDGFGYGDLAPYSNGMLTVLDFGPDGTNPSETGLLLVLDAVRGSAKSGALLGNEAIAVPVVYP